MVLDMGISPLHYMLRLHTTNSSNTRVANFNCIEENYSIAIFFLLSLIACGMGASPKSNIHPLKTAFGSNLPELFW